MVDGVLNGDRARGSPADQGSAETPYPPCSTRSARSVRAHTHCLPACWGENSGGLRPRRYPWERPRIYSVVRIFIRVDQPEESLLMFELSELPRRAIFNHVEISAFPIYFRPEVRIYLPVSKTAHPIQRPIKSSTRSITLASLPAIKD